MTLKHRSNSSDSQLAEVVRRPHSSRPQQPLWKIVTSYLWKKRWHGLILLSLLLVIVAVSNRLQFQLQTKAKVTFQQPHQMAEMTSMKDLRRYLFSKCAYISQKIRFT